MDRERLDVATPPTGGEPGPAPAWREVPIPADELDGQIAAAAYPSRGFFFLLFLSAGIASFGLIADSVAVVIGAMIIAPMMNPIVAIPYATLRGDRVLLWRSVGAVVAGMIVVLATSAVISFVVGQGVAGDEVLSRINPNLLDLGIAVFSGMAGAYAVTRKKIANALPGVAISIALVPPLCVAGIGFSHGGQMLTQPGWSLFDEVVQIEIGAMLLFATNLAAIVLCGGIIFALSGYRSGKSGVHAWGFWGLVAAVLVIPLGVSFERVWIRNQIVRTLHEYSLKRPDVVLAYIERVEVLVQSDVVEVAAEVRSPRGVIDAELIDDVTKELERLVKRPVAVNVFVLEYDRMQVAGGENTIVGPAAGGNDATGPGAAGRRAGD